MSETAPRDISAEGGRFSYNLPYRRRKQAHRGRRNPSPEQENLPKDRGLVPLKHSCFQLMKYKVVLEPQEEGGYTVYVPSLPGCVSQGETAEEVDKTLRAVANIKEAIAGCLKSAPCRSVSPRGLSPPNLWEPARGGDKHSYKGFWTP